ncbi:hypothetical protein [Euzebya sp.]
MVSSTCRETGVITTTGPEAGGSELAWVAQLPEAIGCEPMPHRVTRQITTDEGTVIPRSESIREARLREAVTALGVEPCCGEPSHGGSGATTGMIWEGVAVGITAGPPAFDGGAAESGSDVVEVGDGQAAVTLDEQPQVRFDCGDTHYSMSDFDGRPEDAAPLIRAAESLVAELTCTPTVT